MKTFKKTLGNRIRHGRERLQMSQKELAAQMGISSSQIISQIETGERNVKAWELVKLADILKVSFSELLTPERPESAPVVLWCNHPGKDKEAVKAKFIKKCKDYQNLEKAASIRQYSKLPAIPVDINTIDDHIVSEIAERMTRELDPGRKPALALEKVLEDQYGVKIWYEDLGEKGSAASTIGSFGPAILMNSRQAPRRRNYNLAHELFHLITWDSVPPEVLIQNQSLFEQFEKYANAFASALLIPADSVCREFEKRLKNNAISYTDIIDIAHRFGVSGEALLYRLSHLNQINRKRVDKIISDPGFQKIDKAAMHGKWQDPPPIPERFVWLGFVAYQKGNVSGTRLAEYLETSLCDLKNMLLEYGLDEDEDYEARIHIV